MTTPIEHRYLVNGDVNDWREDRQSAMRIQQGYLFIGSRFTAYVSLENANKASLCFREENLGIPDHRFKFPIPRFIGNMLFQVCGKRVVKRTRHQVVHEQRTIRVNEFRGPLQGLILAEVELATNDETIVLPDWITMDVTMNPAYTFAALAKNGSPKKSKVSRSLVR